MKKLSKHLNKFERSLWSTWTWLSAFVTVYFVPIQGPVQLSMFDTGSRELEEMCFRLVTANRGLQQKAFLNLKKKKKGGRG